MQHSYIVIYLTVYLLHLSALCQAENTTTVKRPKIYTLNEAVAVWKSLECPFPVASWHKQNDDDNPFFSTSPDKLEPCQKLENVDSGDDLDIAFKKHFCQAFYQISFYICKTEMRSFVESCLTHAALETVPLLEPCSYLSNLNFRNDYTFKNAAVQCKRNCEDKELKDVCKLYASTFYQRINKNNCSSSKADSKTQKQFTEKNTKEDVTLISNGSNSVTGATKTAQDVNFVTKQTSSSTNLTTTEVKTSKPPTQTQEQRPPQSTKASEELLKNGDAVRNNTHTQEKPQTVMSTESENEEPKISNTTLVTSVSKLITSPPSKQPEQNLHDAVPTKTNVDTATVLEQEDIDLNETSDNDEGNIEQEKTYDVHNEKQNNNEEKAKQQNIGASQPSEETEKKVNDEDNIDQEKQNNKEEKAKQQSKGVSQPSEETEKKVDNDDEDDIDQEKQNNKGEKAKQQSKGVSQPSEEMDIRVDEELSENDNGGKHLQSNKKGEADKLSINTDIDENPGSGHFLAYFLTAVIICISGYVVYHNKQKILAFIIEGRNSGRNGRQRSKEVKYTQLKSSVEEVLPSLEQVTTSKNFVY